MDGYRFDEVLRTLAGSRRTVLGGAIATVAGLAGLTEVEAKKHRKRCKAPKVKCGKKCLPAGSCCSDEDCGTCQICSGKTCVVVPAGTACGVGGTCNGNACINEGAFGCTAAQDFCSGGEITACPRSGTPDAACFVRDGDALCGVGDCFIASTDEECEEKLGPGAIRVPCAPCTLQSPPQGDWGACVIPVTS